MLYVDIALSSIASCILTGKVNTKMADFTFFQYINYFYVSSKCSTEPSLSFILLSCQSVTVEDKSEREKIVCAEVSKKKSISLELTAVPGCIWCLRVHKKSVHKVVQV